MGTVISPDALKNPIGALADHLVLLVYGANSLAIDFGPEEMTIKTVWNKLKIMRPHSPRVLFLGSYLCHGRLAEGQTELQEWLPAPACPTSA